MSFVTKQQCLRQPDTHFVISGYQDSASKDALGRCLCPIGMQFDYDSKRCIVPAREPEIVQKWPLPLNNYSLEESCRFGFEPKTVDGVNVCVATRCPAGETLTSVRGVPRCIADGSYNDITYGYLQTKPCSRVSAPLDLLNADELMMRQQGGYLTYFPDKCPNAPKPLPQVGETPEIWPIKHPEKIPVLMDAMGPSEESWWAKLSQDQRVLLITGSVGVLILIWLIVLLQWLKK